MNFINWKLKIVEKSEKKSKDKFAHGVPNGRIQTENTEEKSNSCFVKRALNFVLSLIRHQVACLEALVSQLYCDWVDLWCA